MVTDRQLRKELERRARVVAGWQQRSHTKREKDVIEEYLIGGDARKLPAGYQSLHKTVK